MSSAKLVVLISGNGSNLQAIIDACAQKKLAAGIVAVISNKATAYGLERARLAHIPAHVKSKSTDQDRQQYDRELADLVTQFKPDWIVLAGWMHVLSNAFLQRFPSKVINLHPALPSEFPGIKSIERALIAFQKNEIKQTGVMVHLVPDEGIDCGPVLAQQIVPINADDTLATLSERVHQTEHKLLIETLQKLINNHPL